MSRPKEVCWQIEMTCDGKLSICSNVLCTKGKLLQTTWWLHSCNWKLNLRSWHAKTIFKMLIANKKKQILEKKKYSIVDEIGSEAQNQLMHNMIWKKNKLQLCVEMITNETLNHDLYKIICWSSSHTWPHPYLNEELFLQLENLITNMIWLFY